MDLTRKTVGEAMSPLLEELEITLWEFEVESETKPNFTTAGFRGSLKIFTACMLDKMWELQETEGIDIEDRANMSTKCGEDIRKLVNTYTGIDTHDLYK